MKLRLPHKFQAALMAAIASVSFTTLSTGTIAVATGAALLAGQQAQAVSLDDAVLHTENITSTITVEDWDSTAMSVAIELDMAAFKDYLTSTWIAGSGRVETIFNVEGTWNTATGGRTDTEGLNINGSSGSKYGTPYAQATSPNGSATNVKLNNLSENLKFNASTNWDNYEAMSVVLTFNGGSEMTATWYIKNADGTTSTYYGSNTGVKWSSSTAFTPDGTIKNISTDMVNYMAVFDSKLSQADSATIASAVFTRPPSDYGMEFSGDVFTIEHASDHTFHDATFSSWYQDAEEQWKKGSQTWAGTSATYYVGEDERTLQNGNNRTFWRRMFGDANSGDAALLGNTIRLARATTGTVYYEAQFSPFRLGGIIAEAGDATYIVGRKSGECAITLQAREGASANIFIESDTVLSVGTADKNSGNVFTVATGGTWHVGAGKTLSIGQHNGSTLANAKAITFKTGVTVSMVGGGTVDMTHTNNLTIESGATVEVGENTLAKFANGTTLNGTVNNAGTATFNGLTRGTGSALTNTGTLTLDGTITFGGSAITNNATGTVGFGDNVKFNLDTLTATGSDADGWTFTLFSGTGTGVDLSGFDVTNIIMTTHGGTVGKNWDFSTLNQISYTVNPEKVWDAGVGNWNYTDANWTGQKFEQGNIAVFNNDAIVAVQGAVEAGGITVTGSNEAGVNISAGTDASLTADTVRVDAGNNLVTGIAIENLQDFNVAGNWTIAADQALGAGTINGGVLTISKDKTATLTNAENSATLLRDIAGGGNIKLTQDTFFEGSDTAGAAPTTHAEGTLFVDGVTLSIGSMNTGGYNHTYVNMSSFEHVQLDNGTLYIHNDVFDLNGLTVNSGKTGTVRIYDTASVGYNTLNLKGTTKVDGTLTFTGDWKQTFTIEALTGTGEVKFEGIAHNEGATKEQIANLQGGTIGKLTIDGNNAATAIVNVNGGLTVTNGMTINKGALNISNTLTLSGGVSTISSAINGTGSLVVDSGATLKLGGAGLINVGTLTMNSGSLLDVSNLTQMAGLTVNLASYTNSVTCTDANITGVNSSLTYTLNTAGNNVTLTFASTPVPTPVPTSPDLGNVMYVGDSITDGVTGMKSWRYSFFQVLADGGIAQNEQGYYQHSQSSGAITETTYGGRDFENNHSARASARSWETAGVPTSKKGGDRYDYTSIQNWLGQSETKRNGTAYPADKPRYSGDDAPNTYFMLLGTNDLLSEPSGSAHVTDEHFANVLASMFGYNGNTFDGTTGTFDIIWKSMTDARSDSKLIVLEMPTWSPNHGNHQDAADFAYMTKFNQKLHEWVDSKANKAQITIVNPNPGIVDVANTTKPGSGVATMYVDNLHPNAQGELIIAGNVAKQLGYAGRTVGLDRASYTKPGSTTWTAASETTITVGTEAQVFAENAFHTLDGYTIDFGAVYGNGIAGGWSASANGLSVQVGDGIHSGTLTFSEAYVMWGDQILYSRDNSQTGDNFRIAYVNQSVNASDNVSAGYYVWMGDMLIGEALTAGSGKFNGISLTSTGVNGTVTNLTWSDTAYAPTTTLYENPDSEALFHLVQVNPNPNHDNTVSQSLRIDFTEATENDNQYGTIGQAASGDLLLRRTGTHTNSWFGPVGAAHEGNVSMLYDNLQATTNIFGAINGSVTNGDVSVVLDNGTHIGAGTYDGTGNCSIIGTYQQSIGGDFRVEINNATLDGGIIMGVGNGSGKTVNNTLLYINHGASIGGDVFGGNYSNNNTNTINGDATIYITGGTINGSVYGGNKKNGAIAGDTNITITGGIINGDVNGGGTGGTVTGSTNVTVVGNLPSIGGNISADNVTLKDVAPNEEGYTDGIDCYRGTITATNFTLDNYKVGEMLAKLDITSLAATNGTATTIESLGTTAGVSITVDEDSSLTLGNVSLSSAITNDGSITFAGNVILDEMTATHTDASYEDGTVEGNGFYSSKSSVSVFATDHMGNVNVSAANMTYKGAEGTMDANGVFTTNKVTKDLTTFYIKSQAENLSTVTGVSADATVTMSDATKLVVDENMDAYRIVLTDGARGTLDIQTGMTVTSDGQGRNITLAGTGTYKLHNNNGLNLESGVQLDTGWTGVVLVADFSGRIDLGDANSANNNSYIGLTNVSGWFGQITTIAKNLLMTDGEGGTPALDITANSNREYNFTGNIKGEGSWNVKLTTAGERYNLKGDVSGWTGSMNVDTTGKELALRIDGDASVVKADISGNVAVQAKVDTELHGALNVNSLTVDANKIATLKGEQERSLGNVTVNGTLNIQDVTNAVSLSVGDVTIGANATMGVYADADAVTEATLEIASGKTLTAAGEGATLNGNLELAAGSHLDVRNTDNDVAGLIMGSTVTLNKGVILEDYVASTWSGWADGTKYALFTGVDGLDLGSGTGTAAIDYTQWVDAKEYFDNIDEANRYFLCYGGAPADNQNGVLQASFDGSNVGMVYVMVMPEPTTSTLSLLALAALAARRRRK